MSFWSEPFRNRHGIGWHSDFHHWLSWCLSSRLVARHHGEPHLVTDSFGAEVLVEALRLPFASVSTALDEIPDDLEPAWTLGKILAYGESCRRGEPWLHVDHDAYLWKPLPPELLAAPVAAQHREELGDYDRCWYRLAAVERAAAWLPDSWRIQRDDPKRFAANCGIVGGNDLATLSAYVATATEFLRRNRGRFAEVAERIPQTAEQYLLVCEAKARSVQIAMLLDGQSAGEMGFTHLVVAVKHDAEICRRLADRMRRDFPEDFARCEHVRSFPPWRPAVGGCCDSPV